MSDQSETSPADTGTKSSRREDSGVEIQDFILSRELAEVYLLMDHISAHQCKDVPVTLGDDPIFTAGKSWLEQICEIAWPPPPENTSRAQDAHNAAKLIRAKDALNKAAAPASGSSIAFTLMIAGEARDPQSGSWWRRALLWMAEAAPPDPADPGKDKGRGWSRTKAPSRASLAALAYPSLSRRAYRYRWMFYLMLVFLVLWLALTCVLSWDVATGNSLLNQVRVHEARVVTLQSEPPPVPGNGGSQSADRPAGSQTQASSAAARSANLQTAYAERDIAMANLASWMNNGRCAPPNPVAGKEEDLCKGWLEFPSVRWVLIGLMGGDDQMTSNAIAASSTDGTQQGNSPGITNAEWAAAMLGVLATNILPIFYGLLGAGAAVVRGVTSRMRDSLLTPRDIPLAYVQLALGAVIGACIGLFVNPQGQAGTEAGLLASVPLSASALCFVGGFGVEGVFQALESLIRRVFNLETERAAPPA